MKNIWIINQYALPKGEPGITRHGDLANVMAKLGYKVTVFASSFDYLTREKDRLEGKRSKEEMIDGVRFVWLKTPPYQGNDSKRVKNMVSFFLSMLREASFKKYGRPDVIMGSSPHLLSALAGSMLSWRYRVPFVLELRDVWPDDLVALGALKEGSMTHRILARMATHLYRRADKIVTVPPKLHRFLAKDGYPEDKLVPLPNGVFLNPPNKDAELPESLEQILATEKERFKVVYMGAHSTANNLGNVLNTADYLRKYRPDLYDKLAFIFVGGGQQRDELIEKSKGMNLDNVHFHPPVAKAVVPLVTRGADALLVHLHEADTFNVYGRSPNKLYDYLAAAKPVLYSTTDKETVLNTAKAGMTFTPSSPEAFAETLETLMAMSPEDRKAIGQNGRVAVERDYDLVRLGEKLAGILESASEGKSVSFKQLA